MQLSSIVFATTFLGTAFAVSSSVSVCGTGINKYLGPLKSYGPALSYCSSKYPLPTYTSTITASPTTTTKTFTSTSTTTTTGTATVTTTSTLTSTTTSVTSVTLSTTAYICSLYASGNAKRGVSKASSTSKIAVSAAAMSALWASVSASKTNVISTACSCIETSPTKITVTTPTSTTSTTITTTSTKGATITTTTTVITTQTVTAYSTNIVTSTTTSTTAPVAQPTDCSNGDNQTTHETSTDQGFFEFCQTNCNNDPDGFGVLYSTADNFPDCISACVKASQDESSYVSNIAYDYCSGQCNCFQSGQNPSYTPDNGAACGANSQNDY